MKDKKEKIYNLVVFSMLFAILVIFAFTPFGAIPIGPIVATLSMIPVVVATLTLGLKLGTLMGFFFGFLSLIYFTFYAPGPYSFLFTPFVEVSGVKGNFFSLIICFLPRILIAVNTFISFKFCLKFFKKEYLSATIASVIGSFTNTLFFLLGAIIFFGNQYTQGQSFWVVLLSTLFINGSIEALICGFISPLIYKVHLKIMKGNYRA